MIRGAGQGGYGKQQMQPDIVAGLLGQVEHTWLQAHRRVLRGEITSNVSKAAMVQSCSKVADAVTQGSGGSAATVSEYMKIVCTRSKVPAADRKMCQQFAKEIVTYMQGDDRFNRDELNMTTFCVGFYKNVEAEAAEEQEIRDRAAQEQKLRAEDEAESAQASQRRAFRSKAQVDTDRQQIESEETPVSVESPDSATAVQPSNVTMDVNATEDSHIDDAKTGISEDVLPNVTVSVANASNLAASVSETNSSVNSSISNNTTTSENGTLSNATVQEEKPEAHSIIVSSEQSAESWGSKVATQGNATLAMVNASNASSMVNSTNRSMDTSTAETTEETTSNSSVRATGNRSNGTNISSD